MLVIQAGHLNIESNCNWGLREDVGLEGEAQATLAVAQRLVAALGSRRIPAMVADANFNCLEASRLPYVGVLSLHCGAAGVGVGHPEVDAAAPLSQQLARAIAAQYAAVTGLSLASTADDAVNHYLFQSLSKGTPWALVELGELAWVQEHEDLVVEGLSAALLSFLGLPLKEPVPEWKANLEQHTLTVVLNRPVRWIDMASGIAESSTVDGLLQTTHLTHVGDAYYYIPEQTAQGAEPPVGVLKSEADSASGAIVTPPTAAPSPAPDTASAPPVASPAGPATIAQASAMPSEAPATSSGNALLDELHKLKGQIDEAIAKVEGH